MLKTYKASGKFSPLSILFLIIVSLTALPILGTIYAYAIWYIPFIYFNFIIAGIFGFATGWVLSKLVLGFGKVRNMLIAFIFCFFGAVLAWYFHWVVWIDLLGNVGEFIGSEDSIGINISNIKPLEVLGLALNPMGLWDIIKEINAEGVWTLKGSTVKGGFLTAIWVIEFLIIVGVAVISSVGQAAEPFSETANSWMKKSQLTAFPMLEEDDRVSLESALQENNADFFAGLIADGDIQANHSIFTLYSSPENENYLTVENKIASTNKKGELEHESQLLFSNIQVDHAVGEALKKFINQS